MAMVVPLGWIRCVRAIIAEVAGGINATELEAFAARAWPALSEERVDGWLLRRTPSVARRRSNSALPLARDGRASIGEVERFYRGHGMRPLVQVGPVEELTALDAQLAARGWSADGATDILVARDVPADGEVGVSVRPAVDRAWLEAWIAAEGRPDAEQTYARVLRRIPAPAGFAIARVEGRAAGVGVAVCEAGWSGVFCMATDPAMRRRGVARAVLGALASWSRERGARRLYLQVECDNAPAQALYASMGFIRSHGYHFRAAARAP
jgi:N-acetylglutamate synthase